MRRRPGTKPRIAQNPVKNVELPTVRSKRAEFLQPAEWRTLIETARGRAVAVLLGLGTLAGLRISEAAMLRPGIDIDMQRRIIRVQPREGEYEWRPKTDRSVRDIPIVDELAELIEEHVRLGFSGERYLIITPGKDRPVARQVLARWVREAFEAAGIRYGRERDALTFHGLRHTFISWLVQEDVNLQKIERLAGTSVKMILQVYGHLVPEDLVRAVAAVGRKAREG